MIHWDSFIYFSIVAVVLWLTGAWEAWRQKPASRVFIPTGLGILVYLSFIILMWSTLGRPPMRTMGETRMWYSFFMPVVGLMIYGRWRYRWILWFSTAMAVVFICINVFKPEIHDKTLMPALQSVWFVPHVTVYMFAYALLGSAAVMAMWQLWTKQCRASAEEMLITDNLMNTGTAFLTFGMLFGALWAKEAWGHY